MDSLVFGQEFLKKIREKIDTEFQSSDVLKTWDPVVLSGAKYCLVGAGKAVRPALCWWAYSVFSAENEFQTSPKLISNAALALEFIHTYSLIHDDLPAMDNDDFRRGKPTLHRTHSEAHAILTGDALLTGAFELILSFVENPAVQVSLGRVLAEAAGAAGMIGGQMRDIEKRGANFSDVLTIHRLKTGCLFGASLASGALLAGIETSRKIRNIYEWGENLGILFQLTDDLLDATEGSASLGKTAGKDLIQDKLTALKFLSPEKLEVEIQDRSKKLLDAGAALFPKGTPLSSLINFFVGRKF